MMHWLKDHAWLAGWIALPIALIPYIRQKSKGNQNVSTKGTLLMILIIGVFISLSSPWVPENIKMSVVTLLFIILPFQMAQLRD
jgi:hypothetical protein